MADLDIWIKGLTVIAVYSFFYRENLAYRFVEYTAVSATVAVYTVNGLKRIWGTALVPIIEAADLVWIVPLGIGLLWFLRFAGQYRWVSRYPIAIITGVTFGLVLPTTINKDFIVQIQGTILNVFTGDILESVTNLVVIVTVITVAYYFIFTREPKTIVEGISRRYARLALMLGFGGLFGTWIMTRMASFLSILQFVVSEWLGLA